MLYILLIFKEQILELQTAYAFPSESLERQG